MKIERALTACLSTAAVLATGAAMAGVTLTEDRTVGAGETYTTDHDVLIGDDTHAITLSITNGGSMVNTFQSGRNRGPWVWNGSTLSVSGGGSSLTTHQMFVKKGGKLALTDGATLVHNRSIPSSYTDGIAPGSVFVDGGILKPLVPTTEPENLQTGNLRTFAEWFYRVTDLTLGESGLTLDVPERAFAVLCPSIAASADGATIVKKGAGIADVDFINTTAALDVQEGRLRQTRRSTNSVHAVAKTLAIASAATPYVLQGEHVATGVTFKPTAAGAGLRLEASTGRDTEDWNRYGNYVKILPTGEIVLAEDATEFNSGAVYLKEKVDVSRSFVLTFEYLGAIGGDGNPYEGFTAVWQNCAEGKWNGGEAGYVGDFANSFACGLRSRGGGFRVGQNGAWIYSDDAVNNANVFKAAATPENRTSCRMTYDATAQTMTFEIYSKLLGKLTHVQEGVNLAEIVGAETAYFGFTGAGDGARRLDVVLSHVVLSTPDEALCSVKQGGNLDLTQAGALAVKLATSLRQNGFAMDALSYAGDATLDVSDAGALLAAEPAAQSAALAFDSITGTGTLAKTGAADLAVRNAGNDATLCVKEGRLILSDASVLPPTSATMKEDWVFVDGTPDTHGASGKVLADGTVRFGANYASGNRNAAFYSKPIDVTVAWTMHFTVDLTANELGRSFAVLLNDSGHGIAAGGGNNDGAFAGYGTVINWCIAKGDSFEGKVNVEQWNNGTTVPNWQNGQDVLSLVGTNTAITIGYDPETYALTVRTVRGDDAKEATFTKNLANVAENGLAYLGFGTSGGGSSAAVPKIRDFSYVSSAPVVHQPYFTGLDLGATTTTVALVSSSADERFVLAEKLISAGGTLALSSAVSGTLVTVGAAEGSATLLVPAGMTFEAVGDMGTIDLVLAEGAFLAVTDDAAVRSLSYAGTRLRGSFRAATAPEWMSVTEGKRLRVRVPTQGLAVIVR